MKFDKQIPAMAYLMNPTKNIKPRQRKKRAKEMSPRDMAEKKFEREIFDLLWAYKDFLVFGKTECSAVYNGYWNFDGFTDITVFNLKTRILYFIEVKVKGRGLRPSQIEFQKACLAIGGNVRHLVCRELADIRTIL